MKHIYFFLTIILFSGLTSTAQTTETLDPSANWAGYMNVFENNSGAKGGYLFGQDWGVDALKTTITQAGDATYADGAIALQPNFNAYNATDSYWSDGAGGGNKFLEASTLFNYAAAGTYTGGSLTFNGNVVSNTIDSGYTVVAYIKTLDPGAGYATVINESAVLGASGTSFTVTAEGIDQAHIVQIGFTVSGLNANPANESTLGSVIVTPKESNDNSGGGDTGNNNATTETIDPSANWAGYMNVFENNSGAKGGYLFGQDWGVDALKTTITQAGDATYADGAIALQPNFNAYNATDSYWSDGAGGGNKFLEASTLFNYAAAGTYTGGSLTFNGNVVSNTIDSGYTVVAYIKTLDPGAGYATVINESAVLGASGTSFTVTAEGIDQAHIVQIGFTVSGLNANPANESTLGSVIVTPKESNDNSGGGDTGNNNATLEFDFEDDADSAAFPAVGDGTHTTAIYERVSTGGNPDGALKFGGANDVSTAGKSYQVQYANGSFDFGAAASLKVTYDLKVETALTSAAFHNQVEATGAGVINNFDLQGQINNSSFTSLETEVTGLTGGTGLLRINFQIAAGAVENAGGVVLLDNVAVTLYDSSGNTLGITELSDINFILYPNPVQNTLYVNAGATVDNVSIFDLTGRQVLRAMPNAESFSLDVSNLNKGMYLVSLKAGDQEITTKLVK